MEDTPSKALLYAESRNINHDITHCEPDVLADKCYECFRYAAHLHINYNQERFKSGRFSYLSNPEKDCQKKEFASYLELK